MHKTNAQISQLKQQVDRLKVRCVQFDKQNLFKSERFLKHQQGLFEHHLFRTKSTKLTDYLNELIEHIEQIPSNDRRHAQRYALDTISQQIDAIITALKATSVWQKNQRFQPKKAYKKVVKAVIQSSQTLYHELSRNHEFERRLLEMIATRQTEKIKANSVRAAELNEEILVLHARLGRCRKAITDVEEKIQHAEQSNR